MLELSNERIEQILHEETYKTEDLKTILRGIYNRYMRLYERYFDDIDALDDDKISEFRKYHEETKSLVRCYYMDIPYDICKGLIEFEDEYNARLLGSDWHECIFEGYIEYKEDDDSDRSEECIKEEFEKKVLRCFYDGMGLVFRQGFNTESEKFGQMVSGLSRLLFGKGKD